MPRITYFQRRRRKGANFSVEQIFIDLVSRIGNRYTVDMRTVPYVSSGLFKRLFNAIYVIFHQGDINHVTGDINYVALFLKKRKTVSTILDLGILHRTSGIKRKILLDFWFKWPVRRSKWVTVISKATKEDLLKNVNCDPDKIKVVYVPISESFERVDKEFNKSKPTILQIGGAPNKNLVGLIKAVKEIDCHLMIIGAISAENQKLLEEFKISYTNKVGVPFEEVIQAYVDSDLLFFASTFEGFGMPILEAQTVGRAVITSDLLSMPEVGGDACLYVDPYKIEEIRNAIERIIKDDSLRSGLIEKGFQNINRFKGDVIAADYEALYKDILNN